MSTALPKHRSVARLIRFVVLALVATMLSLGTGAAATAAAPAGPSTPRPDTRIQGIDPEAPVDSVIKGLVYDQEGRPLDDIQVEAFSSEDPGADPVASDLTYEYEDAASHGAYELHVPAGEYLVRFSSPDFARTVYETVFHGGGTGSTVTVSAADSVTLPDVALSPETGAPVTGTVRDADGNPLAGAEVSLVRMYADGDSSYLDYTETDADGNYAFQGVDRGRAHTIAASYYWEDSDGESWVYLPTTYLGQQPVAGLATTFTVPTGGAETSVDTITLLAGVPVTGRVTGPTGQPVPEADVTFFAAGPDGELYDARYSWTADDGSFVASLLPGATYTVAAYDDGGSTYLGDVNDPTNAETFVPTTAYDVGTIQTGVTGSLVTVDVVDADGDLSDNDDVRVWRKTGDGFVSIGWARWSGTGTYQRRLDWGHQYTFEVEVEDDDDGDYSSHFLGGATSIDEAHLVTPTAANPTLAAGTITLPGATPGKLRGTVEAEGAPLAGASVTVYGRYLGCDQVDEEDCWDWVGTVTTGATGTYHFRVRPWMREDYSSFTVAADLEDLGYERAFVGGGSLGEATTYAAPDAGTSTDVATITLAVAPYTVRGTIELDGAEFGDDAEASVRLSCRVEDGGESYWESVDSTWTSRDHYSIQAGQAHDACRIEVSYYDYDTDAQWTGTSEVFAVTEGSTTAPTVTVHPPSTISGAITGFDDAPLDGEFSVSLYRWDEDFGGWSGWDSDYTDDPSYAFQGMGPGTYATRVSYYSYADAETPYVVSWSGPGGQPAGPGAPGTVVVTDEHTAQTLDVVLRGKPWVRGTVVDASGPVAGATVKAYGTWCGGCLDYVATTVTDENGRYSFPSSALNWYSAVTVTAAKPGAGYATTWLGGGGDSADAMTVPLADGADTDLGELSLSLRPGTLIGTLTTSDGGSLADTTTRVGLYRWDEGSQSFSYVSELSSDDGEPVSLAGLEHGTYFVSADNTPDEGVTRYARSFLGGARPTSPTDTDRVFSVDDANPVEIEIELDRGVGLSGTVSTPYGDEDLPVEGAGVQFFADSASAGAVDVWTSTDADGHYQVRLPADSEVSAAYSYTTGFEYFSATSYSPLIADMDGADRTYDISLTPAWGDVGAVAGEQNPSCLTHPNGYEIEFDGHTLNLSNGTVFADGDVAWGNPLTKSNTTAVLAPLYQSGGSYSPTWGIADGTLCIQWGQYGDPVYQVFLTPAAGGGYDVVYNYDEIETLSSTARAGYADGLRGFGESTVFPGAGAGYSDAAATALTKHSLNSDVLGRYQFHFDGFAALGDAPRGSSAEIEGTRTVGETLTASPGTWYFYDEETDESQAIDPADIEFRYTWKRGSTTLGTGSTYVVQGTDFGKRVRLDIEARVAGHKIGYRWARIVVRNGSAAATNATPPSLSPSNPAIGATIVLDPGTWTPADGVAAEDLTYDYAWYRNGKRIWDASGTTYVATTADAGRDVTAVVLVGAPSRGTVSETTTAVTVAQRPTLTATTAPSLSGTAKVGETLTVSPGTWGESSPVATPFGAVSDVTYDYTWHVGWRQRSADTGSGGTAYTLTASDLNEDVTVTVTARAPGYRDGSASSTVGPVLAADAVTRTLTVHVVDAGDEAPVSGAYVYACEYVDWTCLPAGTTDDSGAYVATARADRDYSVSVYPQPPYRSASLDVRTIDPQDVTIELTKPTPPPPNVSIPTANGTVDGQTPVVYWQQEQDFNVSGCATTASPTYTVTFTDGTPDRSGVLTKGAASGGIATFHATIPAFYPSHGDTTIETNVPADCAPGTPATKVTIYIDPSGIVTDQYGQSIEGATVTLLRSDNAGGPFTAVPDGSDIMSPDNRTNPDTTDEIGFFRWDVEEGWYRVKAEASGCTTQTTDAMQVPPVRVDLLIKLQCTGAIAPSATPAISGSAAVGETLTTDTEIWADPLSEVTVQWLRGGVPIEGADDATYQVQPADSGQSISVRHSAQRPQYVQEEGHGAPVSFTGVTATSATRQVTGLVAPAASTLPGITGLPAKVGATLSSTPPTWNLDGVTNTLEWYADGIGTGVTASVLPLGAGDVGKVITVRYVGKLDGHADGTATSAPVTVTKGDAPTATVPPTLGGTGKVGSTLTAVAPTWSAGGVTSTPTWYAGPSVIAGASGLTYQPTAADLGKAITVTFAGTRAGYLDGASTTNNVVAVAGDAATASTTPKISGTPKVGQTLTATAGTWSTSGLAFRYQWKRAGAAIGGATSATYAVTAADLGRAITVTVVATRDGYQDGTATSAAVTVVKHTSTVTIKVPKKAVAGKKTTITGLVAVVGVAGPLGTVTLVDGKKKVGSVVLKATAKGTVSFVVKKLKAGTHKLKLTYGGTADTTGSTSTVVKLKVSKPKKGKHRIALPRLSSLF